MCLKLLDYAPFDTKQGVPRRSDRLFWMLYPRILNTFIIIRLSLGLEPSILTLTIFEASSLVFRRGRASRPKKATEKIFLETVRRIWDSILGRAERTVEEQLNVRSSKATKP